MVDLIVWVMIIGVNQRSGLRGDACRAVSALDCIFKHYANLAHLKMSKAIKLNLAYILYVCMFVLVAIGCHFQRYLLVSHECLSVSQWHGCCGPVCWGLLLSDIVLIISLNSNNIYWRQLRQIFILATRQVQIVQTKWVSGIFSFFFL